MDTLVELLVLALGITTIVILTGKLRIHAFLALISVSILMGLVLGLPPSDLVENVVEGFGGTLGYVGLIALAACIIGELLKETEATVVISESILKLLGKPRSALAVGTAGYLVAPPVTCNDTAFLILSPVAKALGGVGGYSTVSISLFLAAGAYSSFKLVFPAAPLYVATIFQANLPLVILLGFIVSIPVFAVGLLWTRAYMRYVAHRSQRLQSSLVIEQSSISHENRPSTVESYGMIAAPLALILGRALADGYLPEADTIRVTMDFVGHPIIAMLIGVGLGVLVARRHSMEKVSKWVGDGLTRAASIVAIVGAGGVLGRILIATDLGTVLGSSIARIGISGAITVFLVAAVIKTAQGSSVITMVTAPSILLPLLPSLSVSPTLATLLVSAGAMISVHLNDSYFWVVTGFSQMSVAEGIKSLTAMSIIQGLTAFVLIMAIKSLLPGI